MDNTQKDTHNEKYVLTKKMEKNGLQCADKVSEWGGPNDAAQKASV